MSHLPKALQKLSIPVIGAPLFIISNPKLVIEQCKAGIIGSMPALNARPASQLDEWLHEITETLAAYDRAHPDAPAAPFAINQIVHKSNDRLEHDMEMVVKYKVPVIITSLGARTDVNDAIHSYGGIVLHDIINNMFAHKAVEKGADGLIAVAAGAGGHAGIKSPFALIQEIRQWFDGPLVLSGSIATGGAVLAAQAMGADFGYIGSAFIATHEARASDAYKQAIVDVQFGRHRVLEPVHRRARQLPEAVDPRCGAGPGQPSGRRRQGHELRRRRGLQGQGMEGRLGLRPGHRRRDRGDQRGGIGGTPEARIPRGAAATAAASGGAGGRMKRRARGPACGGSTSAGRPWLPTPRPFDP